MSEEKDCVDTVTVPYEALDLLWSAAMRCYEDQKREEKSGDSLLRQALCDAAIAMRGEDMSESGFSFVVPGRPQGKGRPRFSWRGHAYTPDSTRRYEACIRETARAAAKKAGWKIADSGVRVHVDALFPVPKSWPREKKAAAERDELTPGKPDIDNIVKIVLDGLNGVAYADDKAVKTISASKKYATSEWPGGSSLGLVHVEVFVDDGSW